MKTDIVNINTRNDNHVWEYQQKLPWSSESYDTGNLTNF